MLTSDSSDFSGPQASTAFLVRKPPSLAVRFPKAVHTAYNALTQPEAVTDADLSNLDTFTKLGGSAFIAGLGAVSAKVHGTLLSEALGMASFFTAMTMVPKAIYSWVAANKKVKLDQYYKDNHGVIRPLFEDNQFRLDLLPDEEMEVMAHQFGIPDGPAQHRLTLERMNQIAVQTRTLWMLLAGPASVTLGSMICHLLEKKVQGVFNQLGWQWHLYQANSANVPHNTQKHLEKALEKLIGNNANSKLARWWDTFGERILREADLLQLMPTSSALNSKIPHNLLLANKLSQLVNPKEAPRLEHLINWLNKEKNLFANERTKTEDCINRYRSKLSEGLANEATYLSPHTIERQIVNPYLEGLDNQMRMAFASAVNTIEHNVRLFKALQEYSKQNLLPADVKDKVLAMLEDATPGGVYEAIDEGRHEMATLLAGGDYSLSMVQKLKGQSLPTHVAQWMGSSPGQTLSRALRHFAQASRFRWFAGSTLVASAAATVLFTKFGMGRSFTTPQSAINVAKNPDAAMIENPTLSRVAQQASRFSASAQAASPAVLPQQRVDRLPHVLNATGGSAT
jgi:hypothetical protein